MGDPTKLGANLQTATLQKLNERSREIFRQLIETYVATGQPVGSRMLSTRLEGKLSPASIRNVMADLEEAGLLFAPHTSAGRLPTEAGLRLFVDCFLELGDLSADERASIAGGFAAGGHGPEDVLAQATGVLSGLSRCAGLVMAPRDEAPLRQVEFVALSPGRALVVIVSESGMVENRVIELPIDIPRSALIEAGNYLSARLRGRAMTEARAEIFADIEAKRAELDSLTQKVVEAGLAVWSGETSRPTLIVRGHAHLLEDVGAAGDLERIRQLFDELDRRQDILKLLDLTQAGQGVRIFIGSENKLFSLSGCTIVVAPFHNARHQIVGALGVIGPTRLNYARVIPTVDYTAQIVSQLISH